LARTRYGWTKRAKELARKRKNEEKQKRRQNKLRTEPAEESGEVLEEGSETPSMTTTPDHEVPGEEELKARTTS